MRILVLNGPNLNLLGQRAVDIYGHLSLKDLEARLDEYAVKLNIHVTCQQFSGEGQLIDSLHDANGWAQGIVLNAGAYSHYSYALRDAVEAISVPVIEVHLSNISAREPFRHQSVLTPVCAGCIHGLGALGYELALNALEALFRTQTSP